MASVPVFVGLDYHDEQVQVCVLDASGKIKANRSVANDAAQIDRLVRRHGEVVGAAIEACCGAADLAEGLATQQQWPIKMAHPGYVARLKQSPDKTDFGDARLLADLERVGSTSPRSGWLPKQHVNSDAWCVTANNWSTGEPKPNSACVPYCARTACGRPSNATRGPKPGSAGWPPRPNWAKTTAGS